MSQQASTTTQNLYRYFIQFGYVGSRFKGVVLQNNTPNTVANVIEAGFKKLHNKLELKSNLVISSRTDSGVHAFSNTAHIDLLIKDKHLPSLEQSHFCIWVKNKLNYTFILSGDQVRILNIRNVDSAFSARSAKSRTYLYRLGYLERGNDLWNDVENMKKVDRKLNANNNKTSEFIHGKILQLSNFPNVFEYDYVTQLKEPFNKNLFFKALNLFNGQHNFSAFTNNKGREAMIQNNKCPIKNVKIEIRPNHQDLFLIEHLSMFEAKFKILELEITAESFLYKMIRKMVGAAYDVSQSKIDLKQIEDMMLDPPSFYCSKKSTTVMNPYGLFLKCVNYNDEMFVNKIKD